MSVIQIPLTDYNNAIRWGDNQLIEFDVLKYTTFIDRMFILNTKTDGYFGCGEEPINEDYVKIKRILKENNVCRIFMTSLTDEEAKQRKEMFPELILFKSKHFDKWFLLNYKNTRWTNDMVYVRDEEWVKQNFDKCIIK